MAQTVADNFAANLDSYADILTTGIAVIGAIVAAAITVATAGAAAPLIAAAVVTGLASMAANRLIKGGRYGWEQAAVDLGMTAVQAITAGVGAQLGKAAQLASKTAQITATTSRTLIAVSKLFTGNPVVDQIVIGIVTGSIGGLGGAAFDEKTWERGGDPAAALFGGLLKGGLAGGATASVAQSVEALGRNAGAITRRATDIAQRGGLLRGAVGVAGRGLGRVGAGIGTGMQASTGGGWAASARAVGARSLTRGLIGGLGGVAGRGTELAYDAATGKFHGDAGQVWSELGIAGARSTVQGLGEGAVEARAQRYHDVRRPETVHASTEPSPAHQELMRAQLARHLPPELHGQFADTPIRVLPEAEYAARTRSSSGPVVTLIEGGRPVVLIREGTSVSRLADEGPHLAQLHDPRTRSQALRLDESTLARWDHLGLDTQLDLYRTKIALELDAHERVHASLLAERTALPEGRSAAASRTRIENELARNELTLRNLRARATEVADLGPARRAAIASGAEPRPQWLDQPARLFSKDSERPLFGPTAEEQQERTDRRERGNTFNSEMAERYAREGERAHHEVRLQPGEDSKGQPRVDTVVPDRVIAEHKYSQLAEIGVEASIDRINELADLYHPGARVAAVPSTAALRAEGGDLLRGQPFLVVPEQHGPVPRAVLEHAERVGVLIRDADGRVYSLSHPDGDDGIRRASTRDPDQHADAMRAELLRHVPPAQHDRYADVPIVILPARDYYAQTGSRRGPVVTMIIGEHPVVVIREGTPIRRLADEGPHLQQLHDPQTRALVLRHDEEVLRQWPHLDLDTQVGLYRNKLALEVDAHERIVTALESAVPRSEREQQRALAELDRAHETLRNLRARQQEAGALTPADLAAIRAGGPRPDWLDQPARLFSKSAPPLATAAPAPATPVTAAPAPATAAAASTQPVPAAPAPIDRAALAARAADLHTRLSQLAAESATEGVAARAGRLTRLQDEIARIEQRLAVVPKRTATGGTNLEYEQLVIGIRNARADLRRQEALPAAPTEPAWATAARRIEETRDVLTAATHAADQARAEFETSRLYLAEAQLLTAGSPADPTSAALLADAVASHTVARDTLRMMERSERAALTELGSVVLNADRYAMLRGTLNRLDGAIQAVLRAREHGEISNLSRPLGTDRGAEHGRLVDQRRRAAVELDEAWHGLRDSVAGRIARETPGVEHQPTALANAAELDPVLRPNTAGQPVDVTTGKPITGPWAVDHIVARTIIGLDPRFGRLTPVKQIAMLYLRDNFLPLTGPANSSKLNRTVDEWIRLRARNGVPLPPAVAAALRLAEQRAWVAINAQFDAFLQQNAER